MTLLRTSGIAGMLLAIAAGAMQAQQPASPPLPAQPPSSPVQSAPAAAGSASSAVPGTAPANDAKQAKPPSSRDRQRAVKLYLAASKLFDKAQFEEALKRYRQASSLDPSNSDYSLAVQVALSHTVTALIQTAAKDRTRGDDASARAALAHALQLDPKNPQVAEHLYELGDDSVRNLTKPLYEQSTNNVVAAEELVHTTGAHTFHLRIGQRQMIQQVFKAYGLEVTLDDSVRSAPVRLDVDDASFEQAMRILSLLTNTFYVPLDEHRVVVAIDNHDNRQRFTRQQLETVYLPGLSSTELNEVSNLARNVFEAQQAVADQSAGTLTIRASEQTINAFDATMRDLLDGRNQVLLDVRMVQLSKTSGRTTGAQLPQQVTAFNAFAEEQSILNANQSLVQQIISSGLASPGDTLAILGILLASGQVSSSVFSNGVALFGNGLTLSGLSPGPATVNINLNSSDTRELDRMQLRLGEDETGTLRSGTRYPIITSSYSSVGASGVNIPGLSGAGNSGGLSSLLSSANSAQSTIPQIQYEDLGLTLKATPKVLRSGDVALTLDLKIDALAGSTINSVPVLNNRAYSGVVTVKEGAAVVVASELDKAESRAISGVPGFSEIPGLNNVTDVDTQKSYASLLIIITPHVVRGSRTAGHSPMMRVERNTQAH